MPRSEVVVWRHGETQWNLESRLQGRADIELSRTGLRQAADAATSLAELEVVRIISSPLRRALATASELAKRTHVPVEIDDRLIERSYGMWEGLRDEEIAERFPEACQRWRRDEPVPEFGLEDSWTVAHRVAQAIEAAASPNRRTVVVTHSAAARRGIRHLLRRSGDSSPRLSELSPGAWAELADEAPRWILIDYDVLGWRSLSSH